MKAYRIVLILALAITLCLGLCACDKNEDNSQTTNQTWEDAIDMVSDYYNGNTALWDDMIPSAYIDYVCQTEDTTREELRTKVYQNYADYQVFEEEEYGDSEKISYEFQMDRVENLDEAEILEIEVFMQEKYGFNFDITEAYAAEYEMKVLLDGTAQASVYMDMAAIKVEGIWYPIYYGKLSDYFDASLFINF